MSASSSNAKAAAAPKRGSAASDDGNDTSSDSGDPRMTIQSDEVNFLVYRFLQENGFVHAAFTFAYESMLGRSNIRNAEKTIPPGALISFLQKGLQYVGIEESLYQEGPHGNKRKAPQENFTLLSPQTMHALTRQNPPIQINVPPATAAAAIKARLETEAKLEAAANAAVMAAATEQAFTGQSAAMATHSQQALQQFGAVAAHAAAANAMSQLQQSGVLNGHDAFPAGSAGAAAFAAQRDAMNRPQRDVAAAQHQAAAALASVAEHQPARTTGSVKRSKKSQSADSSSSSSTKQTPAVPLHLQQSGMPVHGFAHLEEAVARLEAQRNATPMDIDGSKDMMQVKSQDLRNGGGRPVDQNGEGNAMELPLNGRGGPARSTELMAATVLSGVSHQQQDATRQMRAAESGESIIDLEDEKTKALPAEVLELKKHASEVFMCAWNPVFTKLIATGSGDASARIWEMGGTDAKAGCAAVRLLPHGTDPNDRKNKDVTTLEWSPDGLLLATGSYDGIARVWNRAGVLVHTLRGHEGPIFSLKWNRSGNFLLSGSYDKTTIVWDVSGNQGFIEQKFNDHSAPALDVDWKDDTTFASCSTDKTVNICRVGVPHPLKTYTGHNDEVNAVKWDPSGTLLASCSDDCTAKVWEVASDRNDPLFDFKSHQQEIYTVKWSPTGPGSKNPYKEKMLATASFDGSVRLWNVVNGACIRVLNRHRDSVYSVAFSPSGDYLASGSLAGQLYIWDVRDGTQVKSFKGKGDIFEVAWNAEETRVAACFSSNVVSVIDFKPQGESLTLL